MAQAQQIYGEDELTHNVRHGLIQHNEHDKISRGGKEMDNNDDKKLVKLSENIDVLTDKMNEIIKAINDLDARLSDVHKKTDKLTQDVSRKDTRIEMPAKNVEKSATVEDKPAQAEQPKKDEYAMNQRTGNFESQDVAIDKVFYYGKK
jgi:phosphoglycerate-specific signal transduction histidine kinase